MEPAHHPRPFGCGLRVTVGSGRTRTVVDPGRIFLGTYSTHVAKVSLGLRPTRERVQPRGQGCLLYACPALKLQAECALDNAQVAQSFHAGRLVSHRTVPSTTVVTSICPIILSTTRTQRLIRPSGSRRRWNPTRRPGSLVRPLLDRRLLRATVPERRTERWASRQAGGECGHLSDFITPDEPSLQQGIRHL